MPKEDRAGKQVLAWENRRIESLAKLIPSLVESLKKSNHYSDVKSAENVIHELELDETTTNEKITSQIIELTKAVASYYLNTENKATKMKKNAYLFIKERKLSEEIKKELYKKFKIRIPYRKSIDALVGAESWLNS